jgi:type VI secretion system protein ImpF
VAELTVQERLQPALLDRLTDDRPDQRKPEPLQQRVMSKGQLRLAVLRDLAWLFNVVNCGARLDARAYPYAAHSVLNFGLPPLAGATASTLDVIELEAVIKGAIQDFEPRIDRESLRVQAIVSDDYLDHHNVVTIQIFGTLWAQPVPMEILLRTDVDLETGEVRVQDMGQRSA